MLVGDKKGMQVPSESSLGESYPPGSEQDQVNSRGQSPIINPALQSRPRIVDSHPSGSGGAGEVPNSPHGARVWCLQHKHHLNTRNVFLQGEKTGDSSSPPSRDVCGTPVQGILTEDSVRSKWFQGGPSVLHTQEKQIWFPLFLLCLLLIS